MNDSRGQMLTGLEPIVYDDSKILVLGSMPGAQSLKMSQYYAYEQNRFWRIMFKFANAEYSRDYDAKKELLRRNNIALWDAIGECEREDSSLDSKIRAAKANDIASFVKAHPSIRFIITNGRTSEKYFVKYNPGLDHTYLPSTSPANACVKNVEQLWLSALNRMSSAASLPKGSPY